MPTVTRDLVLEYNSIQFGGSTERLLTGKWLWGEVDERAYVQWSFLITGTSDATFATEWQAVQTALRVPRARCRGILGSDTIFDYRHDTNTGFNAKPKLVDDGTIEDTARSRKFTFRVEVELPADTASRNGLRESEIEVDFSDSFRKRVTVRGLYTALSGNNAFEQYNSAADAYCRGKITALGYDQTKFELVATVQPVVDDTIKNCRWQRTYAEKLVGDTLSTFNDSSIVNPSLSITRRTIGLSDTQAAVAVVDKFAGGVTDEAKVIGADPKRPVEFRVEYSAGVNREVSTDLEGKWSSVIWPYLESTVSALSSGTLVWKEVAPRFDPVENRISAALVAHAYQSKLLEMTVEVEEDLDYGHPVLPTWADQATAGVTSQGPAVFIRTITRISRCLGAYNFTIPLLIPKPEKSGWVIQRMRRKVVRRREGVPGFGSQVDTTSLIEVEVRRYVSSPTSGIQDDKRTATFSGTGAGGQS